jgi:hypothetical protein
VIAELIECAKRQEALLSEIPGLEKQAREMGEVRAQAQKHYGL